MTGSSGQWTHVVFTWSGFNRGDKTGVATLYLNGKSQGDIRDWNQKFTWKDSEECRIQIGINYIGLLDELACWDRSLSAKEVGELYKLQGGLEKLAAESR